MQLTQRLLTASLRAGSGATGRLRRKNWRVEGTCVGTTFASDSVSYYHRPASAYALHGYGPALLTGAEMIRLVQNRAIDIQYKNDTFHFVPRTHQEPAAAM